MNVRSTNHQAPIIKHQARNKFEAPNPKPGARGGFGHRLIKPLVLVWDLMLEIWWFGS
jgi:hypothetical protein